ncbi:MAG: ornithine cyclodeaminase [Candidatus Solibacter sp.]|nr:ornithine cyclodeaminase [Candidatus Solibacter sp.]
MAELIDAMQAALIAFSAGRVVQPVRTVMEYRGGAFFGLMPALDPDGLLGAKILTVVPENLASGLPSHQALIALFEPGSGAVLAIVDGRYITEARTAAVSAVSVRHMAREDARVLAIIGSGVQAHSHMEALRMVREFEEVRVWSPNRERLEKFAGDWKVKSAGKVKAAASAEEAVRGADVVVLATASNTPVIEGAWVGDGAHVVAVGACRPTTREMPTELVARALVVVDSQAAAMKEAGDILLPIAEGRITADHIHAELGAVAGEVRAGRAGAEQVTLFKSLGLAIEDVVSAGLAYRRAVAGGRGIQVPL